MKLALLTWYTTSIRRQLMISIALIHAIMMTLFVIDLVSKEDKFLQEQMINNLKSLSYTISINSRQAVLSNDIIGLEEIISSVKPYPNIRYAMIIDKVGKVLAHTDSSKLGLFTSDILSIKLLKSDKKEQLLNNDLLSLDYAYPIFVEQEFLGWVRLSFEKSQLLHSQNLIYFEGLLYTLLAISIGMFIAFFMSKDLTKSLRNLKDIVHATMEGKRHLRALITRHDEIGQLAHEFNSMLTTLEDKENDLNKSQSKLKQLNIDLESRIDERTEELQNTANELTDTLNILQQSQKQLIESEKMSSLGSLVAGVSHEINTPLGISLTGSSHIELETDKLISAIQEDTLTKSSLTTYLTMVKEMSHSMNLSLETAANLVKSFKQVAVDQHTEEKRDFNLKEYCNDIVLSLHAKLRHQNITINNHINEHITIYSYAGIFSQILTNLIMNSIVHGFEEMLNEKEKTIHIQASILKDDSLLFTYKDNGKGVNKDILDKIFDPFFTTKLGQGGSGLGLNIIYNLITHKLKGTIDCESEMHQGLTMNITIPASELIR